MAQAVSHSQSAFGKASPWIIATVVVSAVVAGIATQHLWLPRVQELIAQKGPSGHEEQPGATSEKKASADEHEGHDHTGHDEATSLELSQQARKNIGLKEGKVALSEFTKSVTVPGIVVERPGQSTLEVTAPLTGIVKEIFAIQGSVVVPGQKLFDIRLTHEEVVQAQANMLRTVEELSVITKEIERIAKLSESGGIAGKTLLERQYEQQRQQAILRAERQTLLLHGLNQDQVDQIEKNKTLLQAISVCAPATKATSGTEARSLQLEKLKVSPGQHVNAGDSLAEISDHFELFIEGIAFERDAAEIHRAAADGLPITASVEVDDRNSEAVGKLEILYVANQINVENRTLHFYVRLPNEKLREREAKDGYRFVSWRYRPGQRMLLDVPVENWKDRIVVPTEALAQEGAESYVFAANGDHFDRRPVHVEYRDSTHVVVANDGSIFPGDTIALSGAQQLHLALKNKAGGGIDPHAGHNH